MTTGFKCYIKRRSDRGFSTVFKSISLSMWATKKLMITLSDDVIIFYNNCADHRIGIDVTSPFLCQFYC
ncbi:Uncharacterised protein [Mycobacterium tuberculosis]|nr:Uncharacterised protein [Mycobacterium tuberculosis]